MRADFNATMNVYAGDVLQNLPPATPLVHAGIPCRLVPQAMISYADPILNDSLFWVTHNTGFVVGCPVGPGGAATELLFKVGKGDILEMLDGSGLWFQVIWVQDVVPAAGVPYSRSVVMPYPLPF